MSLSRRRFLQLSAAGAAAWPLHAYAKKDPADVSIKINHSLNNITRNPYPGHVAGVAKLPPWDGATGSESVPGSMRQFRGNHAGTYYGSGTLSENLRLHWKFRMSDFKTTFQNKPHTWSGTGWTGQTLKVGDYVWAADVGGHLHCWEARTGKLVWFFSGDRMFKGSPAFYKNRIYIPGVDNHIRCIDAATGKLIWDWSSWADNDSSPRILDGKLYIGGEDGDLKCFDAETGKLEWKESYGRGKGEEPGSEGIECSLAIADHIAYFGHLEGIVRAYHLKDRKLVWKTAKLGFDIDASALVVGDKLYVGIEEGKHTLYCLDRATGKTIWGKHLSGGLWGSPSKFEGNVIASTAGGRMVSLDGATGNENWSYKIGRGSWYSPQIVDGKVMFGSYGEHFEMLDAKTGKSIWKGHLGDRTHSGAAIEDGYCWFGGGSGYMYCWGP